MTDECRNCGADIGRDETYRCPDCGVNLVDDESSTTGRDNR